MGTSIPDEMELATGPVELAGLTLADLKLKPYDNVCCFLATIENPMI